MIRGRVLGTLAVDADDSAAIDAHESPDQMPLPTLDERANVYLCAVHGDREFTNEEYAGARNLILKAMAADIAARSNTRSPENASLPAQLPAGVEHERPTEFADASLVIGASAPRFFSAGQLPKRIATIGAAAAIAAVAGYWVAGIATPWLNAPAPDSRVAIQASPPEPLGRTSPGVDPPVMAEVQREVVSALNSAQLRPDEIAALLKHGDELIADGRFRLARLVLGQAAEAGSAAAALALGRTYDPIQPERSGVRPDAPPDIAMARAWYEKAKNLGSAEAARRLGQLPGSGSAPARSGP